MRKVVFGLGISIAGFITQLNGTVDFLFMPKDYSMAPFFKTIDTAIVGCKTLNAALAVDGSFDASMLTHVFSRSNPADERDGVVFTNERPRLSSPG